MDDTRIPRRKLDGRWSVGKLSKGWEEAVDTDGDEWLLGVRN